MRKSICEVNFAECEVPLSNHEVKFSNHEINSSNCEVTYKLNRLGSARRPLGSPPIGGLVSIQMYCSLGATHMKSRLVR